MKPKLIISVFLSVLFFNSCEWYMKVTGVKTTVKGIVTDEDNNVPADVVVSLYYTGIDTIFIDSIMTDKDGKYKIKHTCSFGNCSDNKFGIMAEKDAYVIIGKYESSLPLENVIPDQTNEINFIMRPLKKTTVTGIVTDKDTNEPLNNVKLGINYQKTTRTNTFKTNYITYTNSDGYYKIEFYKNYYGRYYFYTEKQGYESCSNRDITVKSEETGELDIEMVKY